MTTTEMELRMKLSDFLVVFILFVGTGDVKANVGSLDLQSSLVVLTRPYLKLVSLSLTDTGVIVNATSASITGSMERYVMVDYDPTTDFLYMSGRTTIEKIRPNGSVNATSASITGSMERYVMVDYDPTTDFLYMSGRTTIEKILPYGSDHQVLVKGEEGDERKGYEGIAVDWIAQNLYYVDSGNHYIEVLGLRHGKKTILTTNVEQGVRALQVDPVEGYIFWTNWVHSAIEKSLLDGTEHEKIVSEGLGWPNGLTLDRLTKTIYWVDGQTDRIEMCDYDGQNRKILLAGEDTHLFAVTLLGDHLYWTSWRSEAVHRINRHTGLGREVAYFGIQQPMGLVSLTPNNHPKVTNGCDATTSKCNGVCFYRPGPRQDVCSEADPVTEHSEFIPDADKFLMFGYTHRVRCMDMNGSRLANIEDIYIPGSKPIFLDYHHKTSSVYVSSQTYGEIVLHSIKRIKLDGSEQKDVIFLDSPPEGVAVDWIAHNLYWVSPAKKTISVSRLDGSYRLDIVTGLSEPRAVCLDPANGYMYWTDWGKPVGIERAYLDGTGREAIVTKDLGFPNGLAIDLEDRKLYWADAKLDRIEVSDLDGSNRKALVTEGLQHPFGLAVLGDDIFWSDWETNTIERADKHTGEGKMRLHREYVIVMGVEAVDLNSPPAGNNTCGVNNGGCSHLCLYRPPPLTHACACPDRMEQGLGETCHQIKTDENVITVNVSSYGVNETGPITSRGPGINGTNSGFNITGDVINGTRTVFNKTDVHTDGSQDNVHKTDTQFNQTDIDSYRSNTTVFNRSDIGFNKTEANFNRTDAGFNRTDAGFHRTDADFNRTDIGVNCTDTSLNRTGADLNKTDACSNRNDSRLNRTNPGFNRTDTDIASNETHAINNKMAYNMTKSSGERPDARSNKIPGTNNVRATESPVISTEGPTATATWECPCNQPHTRHAILDHYCKQGTRIVVRATVKRTAIVSSDLFVKFRPRKKTYKDEDRVFGRMKLQNVETVIRGGLSCSCSDVIQRGKKYLIMGKMEQDKMVISYVTPASGDQFRQGVRAFRKKDSCESHAKLVKVHADWMRLVNSLTRSIQD